MAKILPEAKSDLSGFEESVRNKILDEIKERLEDGVGKENVEASRCRARERLQGYAMLGINASDKTVSDEQYSTTKLDGLAAVVEREPAARSACPECEG